MATPRLHMLTAPTQTIRLVDGTLKFDSRRGVRLQPHTQPTTPKAGMLIFHSSTNDLQYYDSTKWVSINLNNEVAKLADKNSAAHLGTGTARPTADEHRYLNATAAPNWKLWSSDNFIDFHKAQTIPSNVTFSGTGTYNPTGSYTHFDGNCAIFFEHINVLNHKLTNVRDPITDDEIANKRYTDEQANTLRSLIDAKTLTMRQQINAKHTELQNLWNSRQITVPPTHANYAKQKALFDSMVSVTKRLLANGTI